MLKDNNKLYKLIIIPLTLLLFTGCEIKLNSGVEKYTSTIQEHRQVVEQYKIYCNEFGIAYYKVPNSYGYTLAPVYGKQKNILTCEEHKLELSSN